MPFKDAGTLAATEFLLHGQSLSEHSAIHRKLAVLHASLTASSASNDVKSQNPVRSDLTGPAMSSSDASDTDSEVMSAIFTMISDRNIFVTKMPQIIPRLKHEALENQGNSSNQVRFVSKYKLRQYFCLFVIFELLPLLLQDVHRNNFLSHPDSIGWNKAAWSTGDW